MSARALVIALFLGCTRAREPSDTTPKTPLDGCKSDTRDGATTWDCGAGFLAMDATVAAVATDDEIAKNFASFVEPFGKDVVAREDAPRAVRGVAHPAVRVRVDMPEHGRFVATMMVVRRSKATRVLTCSAKESDSARCDAVLTHLAERAMDAP